ncbi:MAG: transglycosylase SLT domain-containing protein [Gammaproteobacteria bacterium]|nr:transglycosylase SLT domain-containing protein [Gammaproteobacteria bacterium]
MRHPYPASRRWCVLALMGVLWFVATPAHASTYLNEQRSTYLDANSLLNQKKVSAWLKLKPELKDYPLYHYLIIKEVRATHSDYSNKQIDRIISRVDVPLPSRFRNWWLDRLIVRNDWELIIKHFSQSDTTETKCAVARGVLNTGSREDAMRHIEPLWLVSRSQPKQCDPLFDYALKHGLIDDDLIWQRILLTSQKNQSNMTKYLRGLLRSDEVKNWAKRLNQTHRNPRTMLRKHIDRWSQSHYGRQVITYGMVKITRKDSDAGYAFWQELKSRESNAVKRLTDTEKRIAQILGWRRHLHAYSMLANLPESLHNKSTLELMARNALARENWERLLNAINRMSDSDAQSIEWRYWRARALDETGHRREAVELLTSVAEERHFYGFLAADQLGLPYNLSQAGLISELKDQGSLLEVEPAIARIREWLAFNKPYSARSELTHLRKKRAGESDFWVQAAMLFHTWNWHDGAIRAMFASGRSSEFEVTLSHPSPFIRVVRKEAIRHRVPEYWILGIMRQESLFIHDIRSGAGAVGLLQLMPKTAHNVAIKNRLKKPSRNDLLRVALNIHLGTSYFRSLLDQTEGNAVHSLVGYNAGPRRIKQWKEMIPAKDPAAWVESIPFTETRNYVKKILVNFIIYEKIFTTQHARIREYLPVPNWQHALKAND